MTFTKPIIDGPNRVPETIVVTASNRIRFLARILRTGDRYGLDDVLEWTEDRPGVEFYDTRHPHTRFGQFVSRYYVETLMEDFGPFGVEDFGPFGVDLHVGIADWKIDGQAMMLVRRWLHHQTGVAGS